MTRKTDRLEIFITGLVLGVAGTAFYFAKNAPNHTEKTNNVAPPEPKSKLVLVPTDLGGLIELQKPYFRSVRIAETTQKRTGLATKVSFNFTPEQKAILLDYGPVKWELSDTLGYGLVNPNKPKLGLDFKKPLQLKGKVLRLYGTPQEGKREFLLYEFEFSR